ncbi:TIGR01177 family methyltransferase [Methanothermobacter thermautotrophicus]|uniref:tRNA (guanine(10)-N(2))-dimethyltransferase n=1 Tax=Methanothermobacter thermautotrophicus TaxID=145262 RepID=A0A842YND7_METTF|nr:TIGR01177 family methyltransferase [Methanothermobacter thermautotrophicus]MBE2899654.1 TIGR01177 family methyltransferase [Methanothermobacter thermautotrophicus]
MEMMVLLSQEHPELPKAELRSVLRSEGIDFSVIESGSGYEVIDAPTGTWKILKKRLAYAHEISQVIGYARAEDLEVAAAEIDWGRYVRGSFAVRIKKLSGDVDSRTLERTLGAIIREDTGLKVDLEKPWTIIRPVLIDDRFILTRSLAFISKEHFNEARPHKRPFFYPGSMSPKLARCMVNLSGVKAGDRLLDPFCGTGGILIEAGLMGVRVMGADIDWRMVEGTRENLQHYGITDFEVIRSDARDLRLDEKVNAIVTDPPYGISASTAGERSEKLYREFLDSAHSNLAGDGIICMAAPHYLDLEGLIDERFRIREKYSMRMHRSLTRVIRVIEIV